MTSDQLEVIDYFIWEWRQRISSMGFRGQLGRRNRFGRRDCSWKNSDHAAADVLATDKALLGFIPKVLHASFTSPVSRQIMSTRRRSRFLPLSSTLL
jgi:hypothetical protein